MPRGHERMDFPWISPMSCKGFHRVVEGVFHFVANPRVSLSLFSHWISASFQRVGASWCFPVSSIVARAQPFHNAYAFRIIYRYFICILLLD